MTIAGKLSRKIDQRLSITSAQFECVPFESANHLPGAAVVADCVDEMLLAGVTAWPWDVLTSCVPCVVEASVIMLLDVGQKAAISCFGLSNDAIGS